MRLLLPCAMLATCALATQFSYADLQSSLGDLEQALIDLKDALSGGMSTSGTTGGPKSTQGSQPMTSTGQTTVEEEPSTFEAPPPLPPREGITSTSPTQKPTSTGQGKQLKQTGQTKSETSSKTLTPQEEMAEALKKKQTEKTGKGVIATVEEAKDFTPGPKLPEISGDVTLLGIKNKIATDVGSYEVNKHTGQIKVDRDKAKNALSILNDLKKYILKNQSKVEEHKVAIGKMVEYLIYVDPALINQGIDLLQKAKWSKQNIYKFVEDLYVERVKYVEYRFKDMVARDKDLPIEKKGTISSKDKGLLEDLDEGLEYPFAIESLLAKARDNADKDNMDSDFVKAVAVQKQKLLDLFKMLKQDNPELTKTLEKEGIPVSDYIRVLNRPKQTFCAAGGGYLAKKDETFYPFSTDLADMLRQIDLYQKPTSRRAMKLVALETIISKINGFYKKTASYKDESGNKKHPICDVCVEYEGSKLDYMRDMVLQGTPKDMIAKHLIAEASKHKISRPEQVVKSEFNEDGTLVMVDGKQKTVPISAEDVVNYEDALEKIQHFLTDVNAKLNRQDISDILHGTGGNESALKHMKNVIEGKACQLPRKKPLVQ